MKTKPPKLKVSVKRPPKRSNSWILFGLGNPGSQFNGTRHNVGFRVVSHISQTTRTRLQKRLFRPYSLASFSRDSSNTTFYTLQSSTYMNHSGQAAESMARHYRVYPEQFVVIVDNMDLNPGQIRLRRGGGHAGHNGLKSCISHLESSDFYRLYIGVGRPADGVAVVDHVLGVAGDEDRFLIEEACVRSAIALLTLGEKPIERVMEALNRRES